MNVAQKKIILSHHVRKRLQEKRQDGVTEWDIYTACCKASEILTKGIPDALKLHGFQAKSGVCFDMVVVDSMGGLYIVTVIGHKYTRNYSQTNYKQWKHRRSKR